MKTTAPEGSGLLLLALSAIALGLALYVGSYFLIVRPGASVWFAPRGLKVFTMPDYRGLPPQLFAPVHFLDRKFIRPQRWGSRRVWVVRGSTPSATNILAVPSARP